MKNLSNDAKSLFASARRDLSPSAADATRVKHALAVRLSLTAAAVTSTATVTAGASAATGASKAGLISLGMIMKWIGVGALVGFGATTGYAVVERAITTSSVSAQRASVVNTQRTLSRAAALPARSEAPLEANEVAQSESAQPEPTPAVDTTAVAKAASAPAAPKAKSKVDVALSGGKPEPSTRVQSNATVEREAKLLSLAAQALRSGDAVRSLELLNEHSSSFPRSVLSEERSVELVLTLCQLGRVEDARSEAERFARIAPGSLLADSLKSSCVGAR